MALRASETISVAEAIGLAQDQLESLGSLVVAGEVFDYRGPHSSGHHYFSLKDDSAKLSAILWRGTAAKALRCPLEEGRAVLLHGRFEIWAKGGRLSFQVSRVEDRGEGDLARRFEALKARFLSEGLFEPDRKQPLPRRPRRIALITAHPSAAAADFLRTLEESGAPIQVILCASAVQGVGAAESMAKLLQQLPALAPDLVVLSRGGGSLEDLWAFNEEALVRAIAECPLPVINAVGHETDTTLCDFVADARCKTPTAAAAFLVEDWAEARRTTLALADRLEMVSQDVLSSARNALRLLHRDLREQRPERRLERTRSHLLHLQTQLVERGLQGLRRSRSDLRRLGQRLQQGGPLLAIQSAGRSLAALSARFEAISPLALLDRGWALVESPRQQGFLRDAGEAEVGDLLKIRLAKGELAARVEETGSNSLKKRE